MNVAVVPALPASPVADGSVTAAGQSDAPATGFDALLALVDAVIDGAPIAAGLAPAPPATAEAIPADEVGVDTAEPEAAPPADPMLAALAVLMIPPAPLADPTVAVAAPLVQPEVAAAAPLTPVAQIAVDPTLQGAQASGKPATFDIAEPASLAAAPAPAPAAAPITTATPAPVASAPVTPVTTTPAPVAAATPSAPAAKEAGKSEAPARQAVAPAGEPSVKPAADAVATETAEAVTAITGGAGRDAAAQGAAQTEIAAAPTATSSASTPTPARTADTLAPVADAVAVVRGSPDTVARLSADILKKLDGRSTRFEIALDPLGLGRVDVKMEIGGNGQVTAALSFDTAHAAAELRGRASELRHALQQAGFDLPDNALSFDVGGQSGGEGRGAQTAWDFEGRGHGRGSQSAGHAFEAVLNGVDGLLSDLPTRLGAPRADGVDIRI